MLVFSVPVVLDDGTTRYLTGSGLASEPVLFTVHPEPRVRERMGIQARMESLCGGRSAWAAMQAEIARLQSAIRQAHEEEQGGDDLDTLACLHALRAQQRVLDFLATWPALVVDVPAELRDLSDTRLSEPELYALIAAFSAAREEHERGKVRASS